MVSIWIIYGWSMDNLWIIYISGWWFFAYPSEKYESQLGWLSLIIWENWNVPNHQPAYHMLTSEVPLFQCQVKPSDQRLAKTPEKQHSTTTSQSHESSSCWWTHPLWMSCWTLASGSCPRWLIRVSRVLWKDPPCSMVKVTISMAMFNSFVGPCQRVHGGCDGNSFCFMWF